jgi:hypothetical protein
MELNRGRLLTLFLPVVLLGSFACSAGGPETPEELARRVVTALKEGKLEPLEGAMITPDDIEEMVATVRRNGPATAIEEIEGEVERKGGPEQTAESLRERHRVSLAQVLEFARGLDEPIDWSKAEFAGLIEERCRIRREAGLDNGDFYLWVGVGEKRYAILLKKCIKMERGWVLTAGMRLNKSLGSLADVPEDE